MCGIAGIIGNFNREDQLSFKKLMSHRGPDNHGEYEEDNFCFSHSLLKIMDLSEFSKQPMIDKVTGNVIIFNGSIYNYKDLRETFFPDEKFYSNTDTEVLLLMYRKFGIEFLKFIKGMFAIAIYDKKKRKIYIFRDKFGIKPIFFFHNFNSFIFASEIKILIKNRIIRNAIKPDLQEVVKFIANRQIYGFDKTLIKNIHILQPGNFIEYNLNLKKFQIKKYYEEDQKLNFNQNFEIEQFEKVFSETVKYHTITEHNKIACLLSGGLDSSLLSIVLQEQSVGKEVHVFSSLLNKPNEENKNIPKLIKDYNFFGHYIREDDINFFDEHINTVKHLDQPTPDASTTIHNILCREVSKNGFKVLFTGNGGDENFFGYPLHSYGYLANLLKNGKILKFLKKVKLIKNFYKNKFVFLRSVKELINKDILNRFKERQLINRISHLDTNIDKNTIRFYENLSNDLFKNIVLNYKSHWGLQSFLDYEDKNSMAYGVECRVPFLYEDINQFVNSINIDRHFEIGPKSLIRKHNKLPNYLQNKSKFAFAANLHGYLDKELNKMVEKIYDEFKEVPLINSKKLIDLSKNKSSFDIFFRTYSYGLWYNNIFN